jgi:hypothetical protein
MMVGTADESYLLKAVIAGWACAIAGAILNPLDVVKIRMQNHSIQSPWPEKSFLLGLQKLYEVEGISGLMRGLNATILRELLYSTIRIGAYEPILHTLNYDGNQQYPSPVIKYSASLLSGAIGAILANPTDLIKVTFQAQLPSQILPFRTSLGACLHIYQRNGLPGLWRGCLPTMARAAVVTSAQVGSYDSIKNNLLKRYFQMKDGIPLHFACSLLAGIITTTASNPVDVVKTRYMSDATGQFKSPLHCVLKTFQEGGLKIFFRVLLLLLSLPLRLLPLHLIF